LTSGEKGMKKGDIKEKKGADFLSGLNKVFGKVPARARPVFITKAGANRLGGRGVS